MLAKKKNSKEQANTQTHKPKYCYATELIFSLLLDIYIAQLLVAVSISSN